MEPLIGHPASMTHTSVPEDEREAAGILAGLVRISVRCEDFEDLRDNLDQALYEIQWEAAAAVGSCSRLGGLSPSGSRTKGIAK